MPQFGGFMNDPTAQMGLQMGQSAMKVGQEYVEQNVSVAQTQPRLRHHRRLTTNV